MPKTWKKITLHDVLRLENILEQIWEEVFDGEFPNETTVADVLDMEIAEVLDFAQTIVKNQAWPERCTYLKKDLENFLSACSKEDE